MSLQTSVFAGIFCFQQILPPMEKYLKICQENGGEHPQMGVLDYQNEWLNRNVREAQGFMYVCWVMLVISTYSVEALIWIYFLER